ncbi:hypothetical protein NP493_208g03034 [Ridgeia piscesae]|uniref:Uncharacterized protein n=1 Tax=Ridgeia piscesae TaxID=27915 RepID=A0AAD9UEB0_RIDPI|nr:hypothetical protein NP493_208g03034 [Ridgeia piscesae]
MWTGIGRGGRSDSSCSEEEFIGRDAAHNADQYEPIKRLALLRLQPPRNPNKPPTPFLIRDILNGRVGKRRRQCGAVGAPTRDVIVRPWLETPRSPCSRGGSAGSVSDDVDDYDDDEEEIEVEEKKPPANQSVSPLDALLQMATKTFDGLKSHEAQPTGEHLNTCH